MAEEKEEKSIGALRSFYSKTWDVFSVPTFFRDYETLKRERKFVLPYDFDFDLEEYIAKLDSIIGTLEKILSITRKPVYKTDREEVLKRSELVSSLDQQSFMETVKDSRLWRQKGSSMSPQSVHTFESIDTYVMYENQFICMLINLIQDDLDDFSMMEEDYFSSIMETYESNSMTYSANSFLNDFELFSSPMKHTFYDVRESGQKFSERLEKARNMVRHIKSTELYKIVNRHKLKTNIVATNVLVHNPLYSYCYKYYISNYRSEESLGSTLEKSYYNFAILKMLEVLKASGIDIDDAKFYLAEGCLCFLPISFERNGVTYTLTFKGKMALQIDIAYKGVTTSSLIHYRRMVDRRNISSIISERKKDEETFDNSIVISATNKSNYFDKVMVCSYYRDDPKPFLNLFKSLAVMYETDSMLKLCPVCGGKNVYSQNNDRRCIGCGSVMTYIENGEGYILWVKSFFGRSA